MTTIRVFLHVLAAAVWIGGQFTMAGLLPALRQASDDAPRLAAQAFAKVAWPAFFVLVVTGMMSLMTVDATSTSTAYQMTLFVKIGLAVLSGAAAAVHAVGQSKVALAVGGALGLLCALAALFLGITLSTNATT